MPFTKGNNTMKKNRIISFLFFIGLFICTITIYYKFYPRNIEGHFFYSALGFTTGILSIAYVPHFIIKLIYAIIFKIKKGKFYWEAYTAYGPLLILWFIALYYNLRTW